MYEYPATIRSNGAQLVGVVHGPTKGNGTAVILCHGFTGNKMENKRLFVETARALAGAGFWAARFDFFGSGDSAGEFHETRVSINIQNLRDLLAWVRSLNFENVVVLGISMGAATAILTLPGEPVDGLVLWSTVPDFRRLFEFKLGRPLESVPPIDQYEYDGWLIDRDFYLEAIGYDIESSFKKLDMPRLIVQGSEDDRVFVEGFRQFQTIARPPAEFKLIEGAGHTYQTVKHRKQVIEITLNWLKNNFG